MTVRKHKHSGGPPPQLKVTMNGPRVGSARLSAADLAEVIKRTQQALKRVGRVLYGDESQRQGRDRADIEQLCELFLVGWQEGSAVADLELGTPPAQQSLFGYIGEESVKSFVVGMERIASDHVSATNLPAGFDRGVLQTCQSLAKVLDHGIEQIRFDALNGGAASSCTFNASLRNRVQELLGQPATVSETARTGRLEELNGHGALSGRLWEADGTKWLCHFKNDHLEQLPDAWMRTVRIVGRAIVEEGKERLIEVESFTAIDDDIEASSAAPFQGFWTSLSLEELAEQQGVSPASDLDEISNLWPADDDPDELLQHILSERAGRRTLSAEGDVP